MKMLSMKIRGSIGIKKGLGVDEIEIDFTNKTGLVALAGPNGRGKTTLLELMSPYRTLASRKGKIAHHFFLKDSLIVRVFMFNGTKYKTKIKINAESDRTDSFIYINDSEKSETTGKNKEYDKIIFDLFGSKDLFYNSVFCAQNSKNFSEMKTGEIKELFVEFLQIEKLVLHEKKAKDAISFYETKNEVHESELASFQKEIEKTTGYENELKMLNAEKAGIQRNIKHNEKIIKELRSTLDDKKEQLTENKIVLQKKDGLSKDALKISGEIGDIQNDTSSENSGHYIINAKICDELCKLSDVLDKKTEIESAAEAIKTDQKNFDSLLVEIDQVKTKIQEFQTKDNKLRSESEKIQHEIDLLKADPDIIELKQTGINGMNEVTRLTDLIKNIDKDIGVVIYDSELVRLQSELESLNKTVSLSIDPDCKSESCPAIKSIEDAKNLIPKTESSIFEIQLYLALVISGLEQTKLHHSLKKDELISETNKLREELIVKNNEIKAELSKLDDSLEINKAAFVSLGIVYSEYDKRMIPELETSILSVKINIKNNQELSGKLPDLKVAESKSEDIKKRISDETASFNKKMKDLEEKKAVKETELKIVNDQIEKLGKSLVKNLDSDILDLNKKICDAESSNEKTKVSIDTLNNNIAITENDLKKKDEYIELMQNQRRIISAINKEISEWTYIKLGCSKTGLQALEIDGASPLIMHEANSLLELAFGLDFQIDIVTQDPESGREVFWIMVNRGDGSTDEFGMLSGGEKVWIAKALSLGMTLISKQKSERNFKTFFVDESDGPLDSEKSLKYINLYRSMMEHGDFETCFYISHNPDIVSMADWCLDFSSKTLGWK